MLSRTPPIRHPCACLDTLSILRAHRRCDTDTHIHAHTHAHISPHRPRPRPRLALVLAVGISLLLRTVARTIRTLASRRRARHDRPAEIQAQLPCFPPALDVQLDVQTIAIDALLYTLPLPTVDRRIRRSPTSLSTALVSRHDNRVRPVDPIDTRPVQSRPVPPPPNTHPTPACFTFASIDGRRPIPPPLCSTVPRGIPLPSSPPTSSPSMASQLLMFDHAPPPRFPSLSPIVSPRHSLSETRTPLCCRQSLGLSLLTLSCPRIARTRTRS